MALHVWQNVEQRTGFILSLLFGPLCIIATILRFVATKRYKRKHGWDDWHALLALLFYLPYIGYTLWIFGSLNGRPTVAYFRSHPQQFQLSVRVGNIMNGLYGLQQSFAKFSLLALYHRLFWVNQYFVVSVWSVAAVQASWGIVVLLVHIFACTPMAKIWNHALHGFCVDENIFFSVYEPVNSLLDFVVAGQAIWMLPSLQTTNSTRWHLAALFVLGAFSGVIGIVKVVEAQNSAQRNYQSVIWNIVQMGTSIICCCAPIYRSILPKSGFSIMSWASGSWRGSSRSHGNTSDPDGVVNMSTRAFHAEAKSAGTSQRSNWAHFESSSERALAHGDFESTHKEGSVFADGSEIPMAKLKTRPSSDNV